MCPFRPITHRSITGDTIAHRFLAVIGLLAAPLAAPALAGYGVGSSDCRLTRSTWVVVWAI